MIKALRFLLFFKQDKRFAFLDSKGFYNHYSDLRYLKRAFKAKMGYRLDLSNPKTFNEKMQWLKLYDRKELYTSLVDKYAVRDYVSSKIGKEYLIPLLGVWDNFTEAEFEKLPDKFVLKCTHDSGGIYICKNKKNESFRRIKEFLDIRLKMDFYKRCREWPYKNVPRRVIAEKYMSDSSGELKDYKIWCFGGVAKFTLVCSGRFSSGGLHNTFYDKEWNVIPVKRPDHPTSNPPDSRPEKYDEMIRIAEILSSGIPFLRVDLYEIDGNVYFGELTFFPTAGFTGFVPSKYDCIFGEMIDLPKYE